MSVTETVVKLIEETTANDNVRVSDKLTSDLGLDSLSLVLLVLDIEETFDIELDPDDMSTKTLESVQTVIDLVEKYTGGVTIEA